MPLHAWHSPFWHLCRFRGAWWAKPLFYWVERKFVIFAVYIKAPSVWQGTKARFSKTGFCDPDQKVALGVLLDEQTCQSWRSATAVNSRRPFRNSTWSECCTNERQLHNLNRGAMNAGSLRTNLCVWREIWPPTNSGESNRSDNSQWKGEDFPRKEHIVCTESASPCPGVISSPSTVEFSPPWYVHKRPKTNRITVL